MIADSATVRAMLKGERLPGWPPPSGEIIGEERARMYIAWIREHAPPLVAEGRSILCERFETETTRTSSVRLEHLAKWKIGPELDGLCVGVVYCSIQSGAWAMMDIRIRRDGRLEIRPGWNVKPPRK